MVTRVLLLFFFASAAVLSARPVSEAPTRLNAIRVNQLAYPLEANKVAYLTGQAVPQRFSLKRTEDQSTVFAGASGIPVYHALAEEWVAILDFSDFNDEGSFYLSTDDGARSFPFQIAKSPFLNLFRTAGKSFYFQRCGTGLQTEYAGDYKHEPCHTNDACLYNGYAGGKVIAGEKLAANGGWHDAGDYGKKIVPAACALYYMLTLGNILPDFAGYSGWNVPANGGLSDFLAEIKHELDWFLAMQREDGGVYHLITSPEFFLAGMPEHDLQRRYVVPVSSCATADYAAIMAMASRVYRPWLPDFAELCLQRSRKAWTFLEQHPEIVPKGGYKDPPGINQTGLYDDTDDADERFWAAMELYLATGNQKYESYLISRLSSKNAAPSFQTPNWGQVQGLAWYSALLTLKEGALRDLMLPGFLTHARELADAVSRAPYSLAIEKTKYFWNSTSIVEAGVEAWIAFKTSGEKRFKDIALLQLQYTLGCNPMDMTYISGVGSRYPMNIWHAGAHFDAIREPVPGFLVPGAVLVPWDEHIKMYKKKKQLPPLKTYLDAMEAYACNEVCITFNGSLLFLLGVLDQP